MKTNLLSPDKDPMGTAIADYFNHHKTDKLRVFPHSSRKTKFPWINYSVLMTKCRNWNRLPYKWPKEIFWT